MANLKAYRVRMAERGAEFLVVATSETNAARAAEKQWEEWGYRTQTGQAVSVTLAGWKGQYPPKANVVGFSDIPWLVIA